MSVCVRDITPPLSPSSPLTPAAVGKKVTEDEVEEMLESDYLPTFQQDVNYSVVPYLHVPTMPSIHYHCWAQIKKREDK